MGLRSLSASPPDADAGWPLVHGIKAATLGATEEVLAGFMRGRRITKLPRRRVHWLLMGWCGSHARSFNG